MIIAIEYASAYPPPQRGGVRACPGPGRHADGSDPGGWGEAERRMSSKGMASPLRRSHEVYPHITPSSSPHPRPSPEGRDDFAEGKREVVRYLHREDRMIIAIDGPAASGKGTLAKRIAQHYRLPVLDTGLLYRAVARDVVKAGNGLEDEAAAVTAAWSLDPATLDDPKLRGPAAGDAASMVARIPKVRAALLDFQRDLLTCRAAPCSTGGISVRSCARMRT